MIRFGKTALDKLIAIISLTTFAIAGQLTGIVTNTYGKPLPNVNITLQGTPYGTATDYSGYYRIENIPDGSHVINASIIGYKKSSRKIDLREKTTVNFILSKSIIQLSEVTVTGTFAIDNKAPITFSSMQEDEISRQHTIQDIPLILMNMPGVYVTTDGGSGLGDSQILIRGFDEKRIQVLVNNIPVNNPETKEVPWAYYGMLSEVAQSIQVQRGVGTSLYGSGALGGSINIITKDAPVERSIKLITSLGQYGIRKIGFAYNSGLLGQNKSFIARVNFLEGNGWRENTFYQGLQYYFSATFFPNPRNTIKLILHGSPQLRSEAHACSNVASYGDPSQFTENNKIDGGFGSDFNGNVHVARNELSNSELDKAITIWDALFLKPSIEELPKDQAAGWVIAGDRASMENHISHRPQSELHHNWQINDNSKVTSTFFVTKGLDCQDNVYPAWYIPRDSSGYYSYDLIKQGDYYGGDLVFEYRDYHDFFQTGLLTTYTKKYRAHEFSIGLESRYWSARHGGKVFNIFSNDTVSVPIASINHPLAEGDLFYDFITEKPQLTVFGHSLWHLGKLYIMTNLQFAGMRFHVSENVPSNKNYPNHIDSTASGTHGGDTWVGTATYDHDDDPDTREVPVEYSLWDYTRSFSYFTPRLGINYAITKNLNTYANWSIGVKEPEIKHFFGFGSPREDIELEKTRDIELGMKFHGQFIQFPVDLKLSLYQIEFGGKLMQITRPEMANKPGYDYAGHYYVPIGDATYEGLEIDLNTQLMKGFGLALSISKSANTWGEPNGSEGAQKLYSNVGVVDDDFYDTNNDGVWDEGEQALHKKFVKKYGKRIEVGMPQFMLTGKLDWKNDPFRIDLTMRHFKDIYVLENNGNILIGAGKDNIFGTEDDEMSATLPPVTLVDLSVNYSLPIFENRIGLSLHIKNIFDTEFWQRGNEYGVLPGPARTILLNGWVEL